MELRLLSANVRKLQNSANERGVYELLGVPHRQHLARLLQCLRSGQFCSQESRQTLVL
jgi:hypothetical protein